MDDMFQRMLSKKNIPLSSSETDRTKREIMESYEKDCVSNRKIVSPIWLLENNCHKIPFWPKSHQFFQTPTYLYAHSIINCNFSFVFSLTNSRTKGTLNSSWNRNGLRRIFMKTMKRLFLSPLLTNIDYFTPKLTFPFVNQLMKRLHGPTQIFALYSDLIVFRFYFNS